MKLNELVHFIVETVEDVKGCAVNVLDVHKITSITDYMIFVSGSSTRHIQAIANNLVEELKKQNIYPIGKEGQPESGWLLVDIADVVVHVMLPETRQFYDIESFWDHGIGIQQSS